MIPLIDADILTYELGFGSQYTSGKQLIGVGVSQLEEKIRYKVDTICKEVDATSAPIMFLTPKPFIINELNKWNRWRGEESVDLIPNFREEIAVSKPYKDGRSSVKPIHFENIITFLMHNYECIIGNRGLEADDEMAIYSNSHPDCIICSRDKDLRQVPGNYYSWECGLQPSLGPFKIDEVGWLERVTKTIEKDGEEFEVFTNKVIGVGNKFFFHQMLMGDKVDAIKGLDKVGPVTAFNMLKDLSSVEEMEELVKKTYEEKIGESWKDYYNEMADLLYIIREIDDNGKPKRYERKV